ncbi:MAG TPA: DoxX family protein, partial [Pyrinomonadaceae bacterium]|nr:DoxX family protein [Pyrinomonadaceae bacterium]
MNNRINWLLHPPTDGASATLLLRLMAGSVFLWEGILKFVYSNQGIGRFTKLGFPAPHLVATADGWFEIVGGVLLLTGFLTRLIAVPFIIEMVVAMASTKIP